MDGSGTACTLNPDIKSPTSAVGGRAVDVWDARVKAAECPLALEFR
jgi:hypothetical protein